MEPEKEKKPGFWVSMGDKVRPNVLILATLATIIASGAGWRILAIMEKWIAAAGTNEAAITGVEAIFVALLTGIVGACVGGLLVLAGQVATPDPPPAYPAGPMNELLTKLGIVKPE